MLTRATFQGSAWSGRHLLPSCCIIVHATTAKCRRFETREDLDDASSRGTLSDRLAMLPHVRSRSFDRHRSEHERFGFFSCCIELVYLAYSTIVSQLRELTVCEWCHIALYVLRKMLLNLGSVIPDFDGKDMLTCLSNSESSERLCYLH